MTDTARLEEEIQKALTATPLENQKQLRSAMHDYLGSVVNGLQQVMVEIGPESLGPEPVIIQVGKNQLTVEPEKEYSVAEVLGLLTQVHSGVFSSSSKLDVVMGQIGSNGTAYGSNLIGFINRINGMMLLSSTSTRNTLSERVGVDYSEIEPLLDQPGFRLYIHTMPDIVAGPYLLRREVGDLCNALRTSLNFSVEESDEDLSATISRYQRQLEQKRHMPRDKAQSKLLQVGVLDHSSPERVRETYTSFGQAMEGFHFYNFNEIRDKMGLDWKPFNEGPMSRLIELGITRDIIAHVGITHESVFYVMAEGRTQDMYRSLGIGPK